MNCKNHYVKNPIYVEVNIQTDFSSVFFVAEKLTGLNKI